MLLRPRKRLLSRRGLRLLHSGVDENAHLCDEEFGRAAAVNGALTVGKALVALTIRLIEGIEGRIEAGVAMLYCFLP